MQPPARYSISPLPSSATRFGAIPTQHVPSFTESLRLIWAWAVGRKPTFREQVREAKLVEALAEEIEAEDERSKGKG